VSAARGEVKSISSAIRAVRMKLGGILPDRNALRELPSWHAGCYEPGGPRAATIDTALQQRFKG
jgi:hypothetical protein